MKQHQRRVALVTGANKGIGLEIARQLGRQHITVLLGARDGGRGDAAAAALRDEGIDAQALVLDVTDAASIGQAGAAIAAQYGRLDILVNNAGINVPGDGPPGAVPTGIARQVFETNFFGPLAVTQALLPLLKAAPAGRIVNMSSTLGSLAGNADPSSPYYGARLIAYNASKAALNMLTVQLAAELRETSVVATAVSPGYVRTDLTGNTGFLSAEQAAVTPVRVALQEDGALQGKFVDADGPVAW